MRGRTNYTGGAVPVINGEIKNYEVASGSSISKGDFVELIWSYMLKSLVGYRTSAQRVIQLSGGAWIVAVRAKSGYQWTLYAIEFINNVPTVKSSISPTIGSTTISYERDLQMAALENNRFAFNSVRSDGTLGMCTTLLKYESNTITVLSQQYYSDKNKYSYNPSYSPISVCSGQKIVSTWETYYTVLSYANDALSILTSTFERPTSSSSVPGNNYFFDFPTKAGKFIAINYEGDRAFLMGLESNNSVKVYSIASMSDEMYITPHSAIFIDDNTFLVLSGHGKSTIDYEENKLHLFKITSNTISCISSNHVVGLNGIPSDRQNGYNTFGGALANLGDGYFVMVEGTGASPRHSSYPCYVTLGHVSSAGAIEILDSTEVKYNGAYPLNGDGAIIVKDDDTCIYIEDDSTNGNTSYISFKIENKDHIVSYGDKVYIKEYSKRAEGFANQSGTGGDTIEIYVPKSK